MEQQSEQGLRIIAILRFLKAAVLAAAAIGVLKLFDPMAQDALEDWLRSLPYVMARPEIHETIARVTHPSLHEIHVALAGSAAYLTLFLTEGIGLWIGYVWAEYLTIVATSSFIPIEVMEIMRHNGPLRIAILVANLLIVAYLVHHRMKARAV